MTQLYKPIDWQETHIEITDIHLILADNTIHVGVMRGNSDDFSDAAPPKVYRLTGQKAAKLIQYLNGGSVAKFNKKVNRLALRLIETDLGLPANDLDDPADDTPDTDLTED